MRTNCAADLFAKCLHVPCIGTGRRLRTWRWRKRGEHEPQRNKTGNSKMGNPRRSWILQFGTEYLQVHYARYLDTSYMQ